MDPSSDLAEPARSTWPCRKPTPTPTSCERGSAPPTPPNESVAGRQRAEGGLGLGHCIWLADFSFHCLLNKGTLSTVHQPLVELLPHPVDLPSQGSQGQGALALPSVF